MKFSNVESHTYVHSKMVPTPVAVSELRIIFWLILSFDLPNKIFLVRQIYYTLSMGNEVNKFTIGNQMSGQFQPYHKHCCVTHCPCTAMVGRFLWLGST